MEVEVSVVIDVLGAGDAVDEAFRLAGLDAFDGCEDGFGVEGTALGGDLTRPCGVVGGESRA